MPKGSNQKKGRGRPTAYKPEYCDKAYKLCLLGATDAEMASFFGVAESTLNNWKNDHLEFLESLKAGKEDADAAIAQSLYQQALDGNTTAQIFWLKNRRSKSWRDKQEVEHSGNIDIADRMEKAQQRTK
ncbi:MAG: hypothetical protein ACN2B6_11465 [Rickettsiales bacterium]